MNVLTKFNFRPVFRVYPFWLGFARLNSHCKAWSYKKQKNIDEKHLEKLLRKDKIKEKIKGAMSGSPPIIRKQNQFG